MTRQHRWRPATWIAWAAAAAAGIALVGGASIVISGWLIRGVEAVNGDRHVAQERSSLGDYFGGVSAVFSGIALLLLIATLLVQQRELRLQRHELALQRAELGAARNELRRSAEADMRALHVQLTQMAMEDPSLAHVWNDYPDSPSPVLRQNLYANLTFSHYVLALSWGSYTEAELLIHAKDLLGSTAFRRYWDAARARKAELPPDSPEGRVFRLFEQALAERRGGTTPPRA
ncbi:DUF6082 family protein [Streptomyces sp. CC224B]|uniref:DUF6082 family protein n=1 Tax=Streptomyces sp. CC224B TaxID=3044571 RepID=UPI0024A877AE|nr:DUF6082 family protein [Streptomyces sp. CC224B]